MSNNKKDKPVAGRTPPAPYDRDGRPQEPPMVGTVTVRHKDGTASLRQTSDLFPHQDTQRISS
jgi:hypothetical protein